MFLPPSGSWDRRRGLVRSEKLGTSPRRVPRPVQERGRLRHGHRIGLAALPQYLIHAALLPIRPRRTYATTFSQSPPERPRYRDGAMRDPVYGLPRTQLLGNSVNRPEATLKLLDASRSPRPTPGRSLRPPPIHPGLPCSASAQGTPCRR